MMPPNSNEASSVDGTTAVVVIDMQNNIIDSVTYDNNSLTHCDNNNIKENFGCIEPKTDIEAWLFDDALKLIGFGRVQYFAIFLCGLILMSVIVETMGIMMIITPAQCDLDLSSVHKGMLNAAAFLGVTCPSYLWGYLSDTQGRRKVMLPTLILACLFSTASAFAVNFISFLVLRFLVGVFISASSASVYAYLGEFNRLKSRPSIIAWSSLSVGMGVLIIPIVAWWMLSFDFKIDLWGLLDFRPWRLMVIIYSSVGLIAATMLYQFPESPRYYLAQGREDEALNVLRWIYVTNTGEPEDCYPVKQLVSESVMPSVGVKECKGVVAILMAMWHQTKPLFKLPLMVNFLSSCLLMFSTFFVSGGFGLWYAELTNRISQSSTATGTICELLRSTTKQTPKLATNATQSLTLTCNDSMSDEVYVKSITIGVYTLIGLFLICVLMKPLGRGLIQVTCFLMFGCSSFALIWATDPTLVQSLFITMLVPASACVSVISGGAVVLFPTKIRAVAVCIVLMSGRIGSVFGSNVVGFLIENNCEMAFAITGALGIVAFLINFLLPFR